MAQSSKYARVDEDVLVEFIYHDQSALTLAEIENDNNGSQLKFLNINSTATSPKYLVHELGSSVVNFTVKSSGTSININNFSTRELQLRNGRTYRFDLSDSSINNNAGFVINGNNATSGATLVGNILTYIPTTNGTYTYDYTDTAGVTNFTQGVITVANKANSLYAEPVQQTHNTIETAPGQSGKYLAVPSTQANQFALVGNALKYLNSTEFTGTSATSFNTVIPTATVNEVYYDTIRLHLRTGYSFSGRGYDGFLLQVKSSRADGVENVFTSQVYLNSSNFEIQNPAPFTMGDSMFSKYVEVKVPALVHMFTAGVNDEFHNNFYGAVSSTTQLDPTSNYKISFSLIGSTTAVTIGDGSGSTYSQDFINIADTTDLVVSQVDEYSSISVSVTEPADKDYFEINGLFNGGLAGFAGYVNGRIQQTSDDISVFYEIEVSEQVSTNFIKTYKTTFVHVSDFNIPVMFRPVIMNAGICSSFQLRVTMRIYNETDNTQIVKVGTLIYDRPKKYGVQMEKIQITGGTANPIIYNKLPNTAVNRELNSFINSIRPDVGETKYVTVALDKYNVVAAQNELVGNSTSGLSLGDAQFKAEGECILNITSASHTLVRFTLANLIGGDYRALDLVGADNIQLKLDTGAKRYWRNHDPTFPGIDLSNGECMFKISSWFANKFNGIGSTGTFYILLRYGNGGSSVLYRGKVKVV
jgi:hypothetical protein